MVILTNPVPIRFSKLADIEPNMKAYTIRNRAGERRLTGLQETVVKVMKCKDTS